MRLFEFIAIEADKRMKMEREWIQLIIVIYTGMNRVYFSKKRVMAPSEGNFHFNSLSAAT